MDRINLYMFRHLAVATAIATMVLVFALWLTQSLRLLELIVDGAAPAGIFLQMVWLSLPNSLQVVVPVALAAAIFFTYDRMLGDNEMVVMRAAGLGPMGLAKPALVLAAILMMVNFFLTLWLVPVANQEFRALRNIIVTEYATLVLREAQFNALSDTVTVYFRDRLRTGEIQGILIQDNREDGLPVTITAERGLIRQTEDGPRVVMFNGRRQQTETGTGRLNVLHFDQYAVDLEVLKRAARTVGNHPRERFIGDLLNPSEQDLANPKLAKRLVATGHERLSGPLLNITFAMIALAAMLSGSLNRRGYRHRIIIGLGALVGVQVAVLAIRSVARDMVEIWPAMYAVPILCVLPCLYLLYRHPRARRVEPPAPAAA